MIAYIKGVVAEIWEDRIILESQNMGYNIFMPMASVDTAAHGGRGKDIHLSQCPGRCHAAFRISHKRRFEYF